jgi:hypothetical protein
VVIAAYVVVGIKCHHIIAVALRTLFATKNKYLTALKMQSRGSTAPSSRVSRAAHVDVSVLEMVGDAQAQAALLRRKILVTFIFCFSSLMLRAVFTVMFFLQAAFNNLR